MMLLRTSGPARLLASGAAGGLLFVAMTGCHGPTDPTLSLIYEVALSRDAVLPGDSLQITLTVTNPTSRPIPLPDVCPVFDYRVFDSEGTRVAPVPSACAFIGGPPGPVPARGKVSVPYPWIALNVYLSHDRGAVPLSPGLYTVVAGVHGEPDLLAASPPVTLRVIEP